MLKTKDGFLSESELCEIAELSRTGSHVSHPPRTSPAVVHTFVPRTRHFLRYACDWVAVGAANGILLDTAANHVVVHTTERCRDFMLYAQSG